MTIHDISVPVGPGMLHYGRQPEKTVVGTIATTDDGNVGRWLIGSHTGTHLDAPGHFVGGGTAIEAVPVELLVSPARVLDLSSVPGSEVTADDLLSAGLADEPRVLLRTLFLVRGAERDRQEPVESGSTPARRGCSSSAACSLVAVGFLTIDSPAGETGWPVHNILCAPPASRSSESSTSPRSTPARLTCSRRCR